MTSLPSDYLQHIQFEGCDVCIISPETYDQLVATLRSLQEAEKALPVEPIVACIQAAYFALEDSEELESGQYLLDAESVLKLHNSLEELDALPPEPGYVQSAANNVKYALRAHTLAKPDGVVVPRDTLLAAMQAFTFLKAVLIGHGFQKDSSSIHQLEIAYSMLRAAAKEEV